MFRRGFAAFVLAVVVSCRGIAQSAAIPDTPAGSVIRVWQDAFNSGDTLKILDYYRRFQPERIAQHTVNFRLSSGGYDIVSIERSEPRHIELVVREKNTALMAYGVVDLAPTDPIHISSSTLTAMGPTADLSTLRVDGPARAKVIEGAIAELDSFYVFPEVAKRIADSLHYWNSHGRYDTYTKSMSFAVKLNEDVRALSHDKHMRVDYSVRPFTPAPAVLPPRTPEDDARNRAQLDAVNCGFVKTEQLEGNVGYVKFDGFFDVDACGPTASAAMNFVAGTRALIIDMRENGGGQPAMVSYVASYLFSKRTHLNDIWERRSGRTEEFWTRDDVPGRKFGGEKPVYVLTSSNTFSGAEEFTYNLKTQKRATIVGETTGGGAHPVSGHRIDEHFIIGVPFARAINPITHTNWEGTGIEPDVKVPAADALATALRLIREGVRP